MKQKHLRRRIIDKIETQIQAANAQIKEVQLERIKIQDQAKVFRHGLYDLFETLGYTINDPDYKTNIAVNEQLGEDKNENLKTDEEEIGNKNNNNNRK